MPQGSRGNLVIEAISFSDRFKAEYKKLPPELQDQVDQALRLLRENPASRKLRFERLTDYRNPTIYTIHVTANHSHKISMAINGRIATLRRIGTHKEIDRNP